MGQQQQMNNQPIQQQNQFSQPAPPPDEQQQHKVPIKQRNAVGDQQSRSKSFKFSQQQQPDRAPVQQNNPLSSTAKQNQQPKESVIIEKKSPKDHLNYNVNADIKHAMEAYDQEQRDLVKPVEVHEEKVPGRDLKEDRSKRSAIEIVDVEVLNKAGENKDTSCSNDPFCDEKFSRDPASDSLADRDLTKFLKVGGGGASRVLLEVDDQTNSSSHPEKQI